MRRLIGPAHAHLDAPCAEACYEDAPKPATARAVDQRGKASDPPPGLDPVKWATLPRTQRRALWRLHEKMMRQAR